MFITVLRIIQKLRGQQQNDAVQDENNAAGHEESWARAEQTLQVNEGDCGQRRDVAEVLVQVREGVGEGTIVKVVVALDGRAGVVLGPDRREEIQRGVLRRR